MGSFLRISNGVPRSFQEASTTTIYAQTITVVTGTPANGNEIQGPVTTGINITLPNAQTYTGQELEVKLNGQDLETILDYNYVGTGPGKTQISFTFDLKVRDRIELRIARAP